MFTRSFAVLLASCTSLAAAELGHHFEPSLGQPAPQGFESVASPDGTGLPPGEGSVAEGAALYAQHCMACHGADGRQPGNALVGGRGTLASEHPARTVGSYWPYATTLFDYIRRAMPYGKEKSLAANETYAITAYVLYLNDILGADTALTAESLPTVQMPNREGFRMSTDYQPPSRHQSK